MHKAISVILALMLGAATAMAAAPDWLPDLGDAPAENCNPKVNPNC
ncbi:hypothetical protein [Poseidonocella sp. HB161398]|nr:hypothetical protein [Poseidonocella sp. HB161398]